MLFVTIGRGKQKITVRQVERNGTRGFTPHVIEKNHSIAGHITYTAFCGMNGCGCKLELDEEQGKYFMEVIETTEHHIPVKQWNALVLYTNDNDYWLG